MKGIVFVALSEMVQEKFGHGFWNETISKANLPSEGIYTSAENYDDSEALSLLTVISSKLSKAPDEILKIFGIHLINSFHLRYPKFFNGNTYLSFLKSVDLVIHVELKKIYPETNLPKIFVTNESTEENIVVYYYSKRKMCSLAHGLMKGAAGIFNKQVRIVHEKCVLKGDEDCIFHITTKG
jgi:predicted hydrocarbon binding protein